LPKDVVALYQAVAQRAGNMQRKKAEDHISADSVEKLLNE
jgi:hypothetical protein